MWSILFHEFIFDQNSQSRFKFVFRNPLRLDFSKINIKFSLNDFHVKLSKSRHVQCFAFEQLNFTNIFSTNSIGNFHCKCFKSQKSSLDFYFRLKLQLIWHSELFWFGKINVDKSLTSQSHSQNLISNFVKSTLQFLIRRIKKLAGSKIHLTSLQV